MIEFILGILVVAGSIAIMQFGYRVRLTRARFEPLWVLGGFMVIGDVFLFYIGFRLLQLPVYIINMLYFLFVLPLFVRAVVAEDLYKKEVFFTNNLADWFIGWGAFLIGILFTALVTGSQVIELTPSFQHDFNKSIIQIAGLRFSWVETTHYSPEQIHAISSVLRQMTFGVLYLIPVWLVGAIIVFIFHRRHRRELIRKIEKYRDQELFKAAIGVAEQAKIEFPADKEIIGLTQNLKFLAEKTDSQ
jgi:hypothetical protein